MKELPERKQNRLQNYDYSQNGAYFVTICAKNHAKLFGEIVGVHSVRRLPDCPSHAALSDEPVGAAFCRPQLSEIGKIVESEIHRLSHTYAGVFVDYHIVMPNHVHMIIALLNENGRQNAAPTLSRVIGQWKRAASIRAGYPIWQKSFHDHVIRNEQDYIDIAEYIENNPANWERDRFFMVTNPS
ncbi:MAG: hypothetical protein FWD70_04220 [Desulfuromonadales bacterium]|nr:hypothetical protein [Desulfuromonadales bacterium]